MRADFWPQWARKFRATHALAHALAGVACFTLFTPRHLWASRPWLLAVAAVAALLPDLDTLTSLPHRTATHSLAAAGAVWWVAHRTLPPGPAAAVALGYASHLAVDLLHGPGIAWLWPMPDFAQMAALGLGSLVALWGVGAWVGLAGDAPVYHLLRTPTPTLAPTPSGLWPPCVPHPAVRVQVVRVVDGDTLIVRLPQGSTDTVRLLGLNAPEVPHPQFGKPMGEPLGEEATAWLRSRVLSATHVYISGERGRDRYGRRLAYLVADGVLLNAELLRVGLARLYMEGGLSCADVLAAAAAEAQLTGRGIWGGLPSPTPTPTLTPTPTPTVGYDYQAALLWVQVERVHLQLTAAAMTATAIPPWRDGETWYDMRIEALTLDESEAWLRLQAHLAAHPPTPTPTPTPWPPGLVEQIYRP